jgi:TetR/AcrR family transcriptional repressor of nem operon
MPTMTPEESKDQKPHEPDRQDGEKRLSEIFAEWAGHFAEVIRQAQKADEVRADLDPEEAGAALLEAWQGAMLRMKIERSPAPLDRFRRVTFPALLSVPALY